MADNYLSAPGSTQEFSTTNVDNDGRPRSTSTRSNISVNSGPLPPLDPMLAEDYSRRPSIRIRRVSNFPTSQLNSPSALPNNSHVTGPEPGQLVARNRSSSAPLRLHVPGQGADIGSLGLANVAEESLSPTNGEARKQNSPIARDYGEEIAQVPAIINEQPPSSSWRPLRAARSNIGNGGKTSVIQRGAMNNREYDPSLVDLLDLVGESMSQ
jgi:hypothetical protein